jgi:hypothetical protein
VGSNVSIESQWVKQAGDITMARRKDPVIGMIIIQVLIL